MHKETEKKKRRLPWLPPHWSQHEALCYNYHSSTYSLSFTCLVDGIPKNIFIAFWLSKVFSVSCNPKRFLDPRDEPYQWGKNVGILWNPLDWICRLLTFPKITDHVPFIVFISHITTGRRSILTIECMDNFSSRFKAINVCFWLHHITPPRISQVTPQLRAERSKLVSVRCSKWSFNAGFHWKSTGFAESYNLLKQTTRHEEELDGQDTHIL